jgi:hypothetical protein
LEGRNLFNVSHAMALVFQVLGPKLRLRSHGFPLRGRILAQPFSQVSCAASPTNIKKDANKLRALLWEDKKYDS